jgi:hypothetical protein
MKTGDAIFIKYAGSSARGSVSLVSPDGRAMMLQFNAKLGSFMGSMPVVLHDDGVFHEVVTGSPVEVEAVIE